MAKNPLQDQLLKAGLVSRQALNKTNKQQAHQARIKPDTPNEASQLAEQVLAEKQARDRALAEESKTTQRLKENKARIRQLILHSRLSRQGGETPYQFTDLNIIKKIYVNAIHADQISRGQIAIVKLDEHYELLPLKAAEKIADLDASLVVVLHRPDKNAPAEEDPYAQYQIPDDLMW
ncbi:MAG TPA: DUF2058 domain-containing protein [Pseudomonadales bacterium]|nr:DUF2058 domain-containing protein [Pseudomonadales bacterium]